MGYFENTDSAKVTLRRICILNIGYNYCQYINDTPNIIQSGFCNVNIPHYISIVFKMTVFENADSKIPEPIDDKKRKCILKRKTLAD
jgi:hypothetical protein